MFPKNIKCAGCGHRGKVDSHDTVGATNEVDIFQTLGKCSSSGFLYFKCPSCGEDIAVDPLETIATKKMVGYTPTQMATGKAPHSNRHVPIIMGIIGLTFAFCIIIKFNGWWPYTVGGILAMFGCGLIKTGIFASEKEIIELTEPGPKWNGTKERF